MRMQMRIVACCTLLSASVLAQRLPTAPPQSVGLAPDRLGRIGAALNREIEKGAIPGAVVLVARHGKVGYFEAFGFQDKTKGTRMSKDAIFRVYSMTKPWVSVAAMQLVEEGRLVLTDPVSKYLPALKDLKVAVPKTEADGHVSYSLVPAAREPTIHDLLRHTSGIAYDFVTRNGAAKEGLVKAGLSALDPHFRDVPADEQVQRLAEVPLVYQPGTAWEYSLAADVLGRVIEKVEGVRLSQVLERRLFAPLQMRDSGFMVPAAKLARLAEPLPIDPATGKPPAVFDMSVAPAADSGGAGGASTATDYARFSQMLLNGGSIDGVRLLSRTTVDFMTSDHLGATIPGTIMSPGELLMGTPGYTFGLGFMVRLAPGIADVPGSAGEFMWGGALGTFFWVDPTEDLVVVYMSQAGGPTRAYYRRLIKDLVTQSIADVPPGAPRTAARGRWPRDSGRASFLVK